jgi:fumarate hydratase class I
MQHLRESLHDLIVQTSMRLPDDVRNAVLRVRGAERRGTPAALASDAIARNVERACEKCGPICQDTGLPFFQVLLPPGVDPLLVSERIGEAVSAATREGMLRPNSVDSLTGRNSGDNLGLGTPLVHFEPCVSEDLEIRLLLKGGGSENQGAQYSLPCDLPGIGRAERDLIGVHRCLLHAVHAAQGHGCSPGILGAVVGGDRGSAYQAAKEQLFRPLDDQNPEPLLRALEEKVMDDANRLGIGPMGFGGAATLLGCKIGALNRLPASFFVTASYGCWALRRLGVVLDASTGAIRRWLYRGPGAPASERVELPRSGREIRLRTPLSAQEVGRLHVGDVVLLSGVIHTGRDALHRHLIDRPSPVPLLGGVIFHCGPVVLREGAGWRVTAAGPTTSIREEPYQADVIRRLGVRAVIGKGGMGPRTLAALKECGAVYLSAVGGAAQLYSDCIEAVEGVDLLELGAPEAMWHLRVRDFPTVVTMDAHGKSLHADVEQASALELRKLLEPVAPTVEKLEVGHA